MSWAEVTQWQLPPVGVGQEGDARIVGQREPGKYKQSRLELPVHRHKAKPKNSPGTSDSPIDFTVSPPPAKNDQERPHASGDLTSSESERIKVHKPVLPLKEGLFERLPCESNSSIPRNARPPVINMSARSYRSDPLQRNLEDITKFVQAQSLNIKYLERRVEDRTEKLEKEIQSVLKAFARGREEDRRQRKGILRQLRTALHDLTSALKSQGRLVDGPLVGGREPDLDRVLEARIGQQRQSSILSESPHQNPADTDPDAIDDAAAPSVGSVLSLSAPRPGGVPMQTTPTEHSIFSIFTNDDTFYTAQTSPSPALPPQQNNRQPVDIPAAEVFQIVSDIWDKFTRANQQEPKSNEYASSDDVAFAHRSSFALPSGKSQVNDAVETASLSSGIESLPSDCTRSEADRWRDLPFDRTVSDHAKHTGPTRTTKLGRMLRDRVKAIDYVSHPMDSDLEKTKAAARRPIPQDQGDIDPWQRGISRRSSQAPERRVRGRSVLVMPNLLPASDGNKRDDEAKWPKLGHNTVKGRLQEVECDSCKGRVHWACAGFQEHDAMLQESWACPNCVREYNTAEGGAVDISAAQRDRCLRPDCILTSKKAFQRRNRDEDEFLIERIVGRKRVSLPGSSKTRYEYLVKWVDYSIWDCTWEKPPCIPDLQVWHDRFLLAAKEADVDLTFRRAALLPETSEYWDEKGELRIKRLIAEGVEPKEWWY